MEICNLYRIAVGSNNTTHKVELAKIIRLCDAALPEGYAVIKTLGYWEGGSEKSVIIERIEFEVSDEKINKLADKIRKECKQEAVLVQRLQCRGEFRGG